MRIVAADFRTLPLHMRMPFRYGIVTVQGMTHCVVCVRAEIDGREAVGYAADNLAPKWFVKNPATSIAEDEAGLERVVADACAIACACGDAPSAFDLWLRVHEDMHASCARDIDGSVRPPLLLAFGASLIERALIDAVCRARGMCFHDALRSDALGFAPAALHPELQRRTAAELLPSAPLRALRVRHTVGWLDALTDGQVDRELGEDGLPRSLAACIREYGLTHFKIKVSGDPARDVARLRAVTQVLDAHCAEYFCTLDGNEQFSSFEAFRELWRAVEREPALERLRKGLLFVEQPLPRAISLSEETGAALRAWNDRPAIIIDEADGETHSVRMALDLGYAGGSHKNCKGVFRGAANACLLARRGAGVQTGEDLTNVGPVALMQDLAVMASLGVGHVERNGHHYFRGLAAMLAAANDAVLAAHGDAYRRHADGFAMLDARGGLEPIGETIKYATIIVATVPVLFVYPFLQRYFVKGVMIGAVKE